MISCRPPVVVLLLAAVCLCACVPWTVRPIGEDSHSSGDTSAADPKSWVESNWSSRLMPAILKSVVDAPELLTAMTASIDAAGQKYGHREGTGPWLFSVKGKGLVTAVNTTSRVGTITVTVAPARDASIQIGPVLRGTSLRDATGLIRFTDFSNQLQFADISNALNDRVLKTVLASIPVAQLKGRVVSFIGTFAVESTGQPVIRDVIPVQFTAEGESR